MNLLLAYAISVGGGWLVTGLMMHLMYASIGHAQTIRYWLFRWGHLWVGGTERAIATTLTIWAPDFLAGFVAGWVALKVAGNWQRKTGTEFGERHLLALVGNVLSFSAAIGAGLFAHPESLAAFAPDSSK